MQHRTTPSEGRMRANTVEQLLMFTFSQPCTTCGETKPIEQFYQRSNGVYHRQCKMCMKAKSHAWYINHLVYAKLRDKFASKAKRERIKTAVFMAYGGYVCACCGETERRFLTLDHINNDGAKKRREIAGKRTAAGYVTYAYLYRNGFTPGYQILCMNCQHGKRMNHGICPHRQRVTTRVYPVEPSGSKRTASYLDAWDEEIVCSA